MKLKIYIIEDKISRASEIKELLQKAYKNNEWKKHFRGIYIEDDAIEIIKGSEPDIENNRLYYKKHEILDTVNHIIKYRESDDTIGISLDIKLTKEENKSPENQTLTCETAREVYLLRENGVHICPMTCLEQFDERSQEFIGESIGKNFMNVLALVEENSESALFSLAYFFVHGEMPTEELVNQVFGFD